MEQDKVDHDPVMLYVYAADLKMAESNVKHIVETRHIVVHAHENSFDKIFLPCAKTVK